MNYDWTSWDFENICTIYDSLQTSQKINCLESNHFIKIIDSSGLFADEFESLIRRETHYALSNAGYLFSNSNIAFEGITHEQYERVRKVVLEAFVNRAVEVIIGTEGDFHKLAFTWYLSKHIAITPEKRNERIRNAVGSN